MSDSTPNQRNDGGHPHTGGVSGDAYLLTEAAGPPDRNSKRKSECCNASTVRRNAAKPSRRKATYHVETYRPPVPLTDEAQRAAIRIWLADKGVPIAPPDDVEPAVLRLRGWWDEPHHVQVAYLPGGVRQVDR